MAQMLEVTCGNCGSEQVQMDGPVMTGYQPRWKQCGDTRLVPWNGRVGSADQPRLTGEARDRWIGDEAGTCSCGGRFCLDAPMRCNVCRSADVTTTFYGIAD